MVCCSRSAAAAAAAARECFKVAFSFPRWDKTNEAHSSHFSTCASVWQLPGITFLWASISLRYVLMLFSYVLLSFFFPFLLSLLLLRLPHLTLLGCTRPSVTECVEVLHQCYHQQQQHLETLHGQLHVASVLVLSSLVMTWARWP